MIGADKIHLTLNHFMLFITYIFEKISDIKKLVLYTKVLIDFMSSFGH